MSLKNGSCVCVCVCVFGSFDNEKHMLHIYKLQTTNNREKILKIPRQIVYLQLCCISVNVTYMGYVGMLPMYLIGLNYRTLMCKNICNFGIEFS